MYIQTGITLRSSYTRWDSVPYIYVFLPDILHLSTLHTLVVTPTLFLSRCSYSNGPCSCNPGNTTTLIGVSNPSNIFINNLFVNAPERLGLSGHLFLTRRRQTNIWVDNNANIVLDLQSNELLNTLFWIGITQLALAQLDKYRVPPQGQDSCYMAQSRSVHVSCTFFSIKKETQRGQHRVCLDTSNSKKR